METKQEEAPQPTNSLIYRSGTHSIVPLTPLAAILDQEDNLTFLHKELQKYQAAHQYDRNLLGMLAILKQYGESEHVLGNIIRLYYKGSCEDFNFTAEATPLRARIQVYNFMEALMRAKTLYFDEDNDAVVDLIESETEAENISATQILIEKMRGQGEQIDLLSMQLADLRAKSKKEKKKIKASQKIGKIPVSTPGISQSGQGEKEQEVAPEAPKKDPFILSEWQVYWTKKHFSPHPHHLTRLITDSREGAAKHLAKVGRKGISTSAESVINMVEYLLDNPPAFQKALSSRLKFVPDWIKEWIKLKRGDDRIFLLFPPEEQRKLILFADGRDTIYRGL